jgi:hypothetical protein
VNRERRLSKIEKALGADEPIFVVITHDGQDIFDPSLSVSTWSG